MNRRVRLFKVTALACALLPAALIAAPAQEGTRMKAPNQAASQQPFFCNLSALNAEQRKHHRELTARLRESVAEVRELADGYGFRLPADTAHISLAAEWVTLERLCCPFFAFQIDVGSDGQPLWLRLTGRDGVKPFMESEFGLK
ncbi:MAG TPA: hypothetical protein VKA60_07070 [Blastocatellia bacterium]|nr:hypothetical protein [Blastocatellia bacterium]